MVLKMLKKFKNGLIEPINIACAACLGGIVFVATWIYNAWSDVKD